MDKKKYRWNINPLIALLVVSGNTLITVFILMKLATNDHFLKIQLGFDFKDSKLQIFVFSVVVFAIVLLCNYMFLKKNYLTWMCIAFFQTVLFAFAIRNIFLIILYEESIHLSLLQNIFGLFYMGGLIYLTLFSNHVVTYFNLKRRN